jgi:hypothetical protein
MIQEGENGLLLGDDQGMSEEVILKAIEVSRARVAQYEAQRAELAQFIDRARQEISLLSRLLELRIGRIDSTSTYSPMVAEELDASSLQPGTIAVAAVVQELKNANRPLHISELMRVLAERSVAIPGAGLQPNLIVHLSRDPRLMRTSRGMYGLTEWGLQSAVVEKPNRRKKRVRVRAKDRKDQV